MTKNTLLQGGTVILVILLIAVFAYLTQEDEDPCDNPQLDISGAILADDAGDQDALANRAILMRGKCQSRAAKQAERTKTVPEGAATGSGDPGSPAATEPLSKQNPAPTPAPGAVQPVSANSANEILQYRCMVCHGCYDAPCQLKLEAHEGLERGASKDLVYDGTRLLAAGLTRLFDDAQSIAGWRDKGFYPVIDSQAPADGVMYRMLELKQAHPLPAEGKLPRGFDFSLYRDQQCPKPEEFDAFATDYPLWGMPYGLPGLTGDQHATLTGWLDRGAPPTPPAALGTEQQQLLDRWETFLNGETAKEMLMSRYLYEHLFLASLYLEAGDGPTWFRLVRSRTPPGEAIDLIATRRPYDDPGVKRVYYRLQRMPITPLAKTHMPYRFDAGRLAWYRELFLETDREVIVLPGYEPGVGDNPFKSFLDLPVQSRYRFLLEDAQFTIMNFIKGPVCRGQTALNVIDDHFWVMFSDPAQVDQLDEEFLAREMDNLRLPEPKTGTLIDLLSWRRYSKAHEKYQRDRSRFIRNMVAQGVRLELDSIWNGGGGNDNAALTVFRHFDTASVVRGFVGDIPKTAWVIDYSLLERIYYLLVAGFDVYGSGAHQLQSRLYMDFLRMEGEFNFLLFMPPEKRTEIHDFWYRDAGKGVREHFLKRSAAAAETLGFSYKTEDPKVEFLAMMRQRIHGADARRYDYRVDNTGPEIAAFARLEANVGVHNSFLPDVSFISLLGEQRDEIYTLVLNTAHTNIAQPFREEKRLIPEEDSATVVRGFLGAYPNYFFQVTESEIDKFVEAIGKLKSGEDLQALRDRYGVRRNASWFWRVSDKFHARYREQDPVEFGLFDYNRYSGD